MNKNKIISTVIRLTKTADTIKGRKKIINNFSRKIKNYSGKSSLLEQTKKLYRYFIDPNTSNTKKALIGAGLLYFIMPFDVVNDLIPALGFLDDGIAIAYVYSFIEKELREYDKSELINVLDNKETRIHE